MEAQTRRPMAPWPSTSSSWCSKFLFRWADRDATGPGNGKETRHWSGASRLRFRSWRAPGGDAGTPSTQDRRNRCIDEEEGGTDSDGDLDICSRSPLQLSHSNNSKQADQNRTSSPSCVSSASIQRQVQWIAHFVSSSITHATHAHAQRRKRETR